MPEEEARGLVAILAGSCEIVGLRRLDTTTLECRLIETAGRGGPVDLAVGANALALEDVSFEGADALHFLAVGDSDPAKRQRRSSGSGRAPADRHDPCEATPGRAGAASASVRSPVSPTSRRASARPSPCANRVPICDFRGDSWVAVIFAAHEAETPLSLLFALLGATNEADAGTRTQDPQ